MLLDVRPIPRVQYMSDVWTLPR